ncbi:hypothetical protein PspLS_02326 [Pyricularia sp. CBS 133598]|nr:hypothetical protein PspLS_02326 [Pyricularia sp. CBS 133598]
MHWMLAHSPFVQDPDYHLKEAIKFCKAMLAEHESTELTASLLDILDARERALEAKGSSDYDSGLDRELEKYGHARVIIADSNAKYAGQQADMTSVTDENAGNPGHEKPSKGDNEQECLKLRISPFGRWEYSYEGPLNDCKGVAQLRMLDTK